MNTAINKFESELKGQNLTNNAQQNRRQNNTRSQSMPRLGSEIYQQQNEGTENPITISCSCNPAYVNEGFSKSLDDVSSRFSHDYSRLRARNNEVFAQQDTYGDVAPPNPSELVVGLQRSPYQS